MPGASFLALMLVGGAVWCVSAIVEVLSPSMVEKLFWARVCFVGVALIAPSWLLFVLIYTGKLRPRLPRVALAIYIVPALTILLAFLSPRIPAVWTSVSLSPGGDLTPLLVEHGAWFWLHTVYSYGCLAIGAIILPLSVLKGVRLLTLQNVVFVLAIALPWIANLVTMSDLLPLRGYDLTPPAVVLSALILAIALVWLRTFDVFPGLITAARDTVIDAIADGVIMVDRSGLVLDANRAAQNLLAPDGEQLVGMPLDTMVRLDVERLCEEASRSSAYHEETTIAGHGDDSYVVLDVTASPLRASQISSGYVLVMRDITDRKRLEDELRYRALHDELTGLPNRGLLTEHLQRALALARRSKSNVALLVIDLDRFKDINDTFGHEAGDIALRTIAQRLRESRRESDMVARFGGDEFAVVLHDCPPEAAFDIALSIRKSLNCTVSVPRQDVIVSGSVGVAVSPIHGRDPATLLRHADVALYLSKEMAQGVAMYQSELDPNSPERLELLHDLRTAIEIGEFHLYYQPQVRLCDGQIRGVEALVRWPRVGGVLQPADFLPLVEQSGLLPALTWWAIGSALSQHRSWRGRGWNIDVSVNLSAADVCDPDLPMRVSQSLAQAGVRPERLWLEITETSVMTDPEGALRVLGELRDLGVRIAIDDFGVGHSSLAYVRTLPASDLKIDRSFVRDIARQPGDVAIVKSAVALAHDLNLTVTAEGVETPEALRCVRQLGCDYAQGYGIARPMPADKVLAWARSHELVPVGAG